MIRAFVAGIVVSCIAPLIGNFLIARRYSLIADTLSHVSLAGIAIGLLFGIYPVYTAMAAAVIVALVIEVLRSQGKVEGDAALAMFLSGGLAVAVVLLGLGRGFNADLFSYLFGSITTVTVSDVYTIGIVGFIVLAIITLLYKEFLYIAFDEEAARVSGVPTRFLNMLLMVLTAVTVSLSMRIVGVLLMSALMVIPVVTAMLFQVSFKKTCIYSVLFGLTAVISGLFASYELNLATGGTIVIISLLIFGSVGLLVRGRS